MGFHDSVSPLAVVVCLGFVVYVLAYPMSLSCFVDVPAHTRAHFPRSISYFISKQAFPETWMSVGEKYADTGIIPMIFI
jgi:hypothetical protein